ncbi:hypothetical protein V6N12_004954 [Hibiscus sabdariffa]|uniref:Mediator of RNA polymerase II transcription subunit 10 n=1 Tax=Hibiscus sabdariffa TaxID=183260 RepID=A0ABR2CN22_9ROSI
MFFLVAQIHHRQGSVQLGEVKISRWINQRTEGKDYESIEMDSSQASTLGTTAGSGGNGLVSTQTNDAANATPIDDPKQNLNQVMNSIQKTLGLLHQLYLTVSSFNAASQLPLLQRLNSLVTELDNMAKLSEKCNIQVPMEVLKDVLNGCIAKNQVTKGRTDAFKSLRKHLLEELEQTFPDEVESYREIRASAAAESKRLAQSQNILQNGDVKVKTEL